MPAGKERCYESRALDALCWLREPDCPDPHTKLILTVPRSRSSGSSATLKQSALLLQEPLHRYVLVRGVGEPSADRHRQDSLLKFTHGYIHLVDGPYWKLNQYGSTHRNLQSASAYDPRSLEPSEPPRPDQGTRAIYLRPFHSRLVSLTVDSLYTVAFGSQSKPRP